MESINDKRAVEQYAELNVSLDEHELTATAPAGSIPLDINRETRSTGLSDSIFSEQNTGAIAPEHAVSETRFSSSITEKKTPDLTFSDDEKRAFRAEQSRRAKLRGDSAFSIAAGYIAEKKNAYETLLEQYPGAMSKHAVSKIAARVYKLARKYEKPDELARAVASWTATAKNADEVKRAVRYYSGSSSLDAGCGTADEIAEHRARLLLDVDDNPDEIDQIIWSYGAWQKAKNVFGSFLKCRKEKRRDDLPIELVARADGSLSTDGRWRCRSKWACPECAAGLLYGDAMRLRRLFEAIQHENAERAVSGAPALVALLVTLTAPHKPGESLREQMGVFSKCYGAASHTRALREARKKLGFVGGVRCFDHTIKLKGGKVDFHTHFHNVLIFETDELGTDDAPALRAFAALLFEKWAEAVARAYADGRKASIKAFHIERVALDATDEHDAATVADYAAKACALPGYLTKAEKPGARAEGAGLLPFEVLDAYAVEHDEKKRKLLAGAWVDYVAGTRGFHRLDFSSGLAGRFGVDDDAPAIVARYELPAPLAAAAYDDPAILENLKRAIADGDLTAADDLLCAAGLDGDLNAVDVLTPAAPLPAPLTDEQLENIALVVLMRDWADFMEERKAKRAELAARYSADELDETPF